MKERVVLFLNSISCYFFGYLLLFESTNVGITLGSDNPATLKSLGVILLINAASLTIASILNFISDVVLCYFSVGDFMWVLVSSVLAVSGFVSSKQGAIYLVATNAMVIIFGIVQLRLLKSSRVRILQTAKTNHTKDYLWKRISAVGSVPSYVPFVRETKLLVGSACEVGTLRSCTFSNGMSHKEKIINVVQGEGFVVEVSDHDLPLRSAISELWIRTHETTNTLDMIYTIELKGGLIGKIVGELFFRPILNVQIKKIVHLFADCILT